MNENTANELHKIIVCQSCAHKNVCKKIDEQTGKCEDFLNAGTYKIYGNIYDMFQPIFDWLNFHYPHGEIKFVVSNTTARMYQEYGPLVASKQLMEFPARLRQQRELGQELESDDN